MSINRQTPAFIAGAIFVIAVAARLLVALEISGTPLFDIYVGDSLYYHKWALRLAAGESDRNVFFQAPLYPYFLGALYRIFSADPWVPRAAQAILAGAGCALLSVSAFRLFGRQAAWAAGLLAALYAPSLFYDLLVHKSGVALFLGALIVFSVTVFLAGNRTIAAAAAIGGVTALAAMAIEHYLMILPVIGAWMLLRREDAWRQRTLWIAGLLIGVSAVQLPVVARNYWVANDPVVASSSAGLNFWIGNGRGAVGHYRELSFNRGVIEFEQKDSERIASDALGRPVSGGEASRWWFGRALREIAAQPGAWLKVMVRKAGLVLNDYEWPDHDAFGAHAAESRILGVLGAALRFGLLLPLFVAGAIAVWNANRQSRPIVAASVAILGGVILFFVFGRYRYAAVPFMFVVAGSGAAMLIRAGIAPGTPDKPVMGRVAAAAGKRWKMLCAAAVAGAIPFLPLDTRLRNPASSYYSIAIAAYYDNRFDLAESMNRRAVQTAPGWALPYHSLAMIYWQKKEWELAEANERRVIEIQPDFPKSRAFLGEILVRVGDVRARRGDVDGAIKSYSEVLAMEGTAEADRQYARSRLDRFAQ